MKVPAGWLREYVRVDATTAEIAEALSVGSAEVEGVARVGVQGELGLFRVGHVLEAAKHPDADRLQLTSVDVGEDRPYSIVCGAWNFGAGAKVAVALPGATLPDGLVLERRKLRGQVSEGMILAEDELDLGGDHSGIIVLDDALEPGTPLADVLPLADEVLDLEPTGNRPDLFSVYGVAREVAALLGGELLPMPGEEPKRDGEEAVGIGIDDREGCSASSAACCATSPWGSRRSGSRDGSAIRRPGDLERRRRHELRHARARQPAARVRPRPAARRARRSACAPGREGADARRRRAHADAGGSRDRRRRACRRAGRDHGRRGDRGLRRRRRTSCSRRRTSSRSGSCAAPSGTRSAPRARTAGRKASIRTSRAGGDLRDAAARRAGRRALGRGGGRRRPSCRSPR